MAKAAWIVSIRTVARIEPAWDPESLLGAGEDVGPERGLRRRLELREIEVRSAAPLDALGGVVEQVQPGIEERGAERAAGQPQVALVEMPAPRPDDELGRSLADPIGLALRAREGELAADRGPERSLAAHDVRPGRAEGVLEVCHEHPGPGIQGVDHHLRLGGAGDLDAPVVEVGRRRRNGPVGGPDVGRRRIEVEVSARVDRGLSIAPGLEELRPTRPERRLEVFEEGEGVGRQDLVPSGRMVTDDLDHDIRIRGRRLAQCPWTTVDECSVSIPRRSGAWARWRRSLPTMHAHRRTPAPPIGPPAVLLGGIVAVAVVVIAVGLHLGTSSGQAPASPLPSSASREPATSADTSSAAPAEDPSPAPPTVPPSSTPGSGTGSGPGSPAAGSGPFPGGLLIADRANGRIIIVNDAGQIVWRFPAAGSLPPGWARLNADDAFIAPDGKSIVANDESHETIARIDIQTRRVVWTYGHYGQMGSARGYLHTPDDAYPLANGDIVVADIENCRILEIAPDKSIVHQWGRTGVCRSGAPSTFARPNGDTPLPDGGLLITEITGSRVVRLAADGHVVFDIHVPVAYPSDAQLDSRGNVVVADFSTIGQVVSVEPATGKVVWRWRYASGSRRLNHPSLATPLPDGTVSVNDDFRHRLIVIDPKHHDIVWQYGRTDLAGRGPGFLNDPDGHQPLPSGVVF